MTAMIGEGLRFISTITRNVFIHPRAIIIGSVKLSSGVSVWPNAVIRGDVNTITIGENTNIQDGTIIHCGAKTDCSQGYPTKIGSRVSIGHMAMLHGCTVEDDVLIGMKATVMDGAIIPSNTIVGAGALVSPKKVLEPNGLYVGNPAKRVRDLKKEELELIRRNAKMYTDLKDKYLSGKIADPSLAFLYAKQS